MKILKNVTDTVSVKWDKGFQISRGVELFFYVIRLSGTKRDKKLFQNRVIDIAAFLI